MPLAPFRVPARVGFRIRIPVQKAQPSMIKASGRVAETSEDLVSLRHFSIAQKIPMDYSWNNSGISLHITTMAGRMSHLTFRVTFTYRMTIRKWIVSWFVRVQGQCMGVSHGGTPFSHIPRMWRWLVVDLPLFEFVSWDHYSQLNGQIKHVPNHQPVKVVSALSCCPV